MKFFNIASIVVVFVANRTTGIEDYDVCAQGNCVSNFQEFQDALGQDKSSAEINICAGTTINFSKPLYIYSNSIGPPQPPFDLKLLCCDCNCVLNAVGASGTENYNAITFGNEQVGLVSGMKLDMNGIRLEHAPDDGGFFFYIRDESIYKRVGSCPNSFDLSTIKIPFTGMPGGKSL